MARSFTDFDSACMRRALALARRGEGRVEPNPMVGCVIARDGRFVGEGWHRWFGGPHAEVHALRAAGDAARGATAYVTLEPCCIFGKTPPCTDALLTAGVARVVAAVCDPNPAVDGGGLRALRHAGVTVERGLFEAEGAELIAPFATRMVVRRPYVIAKWAQSLDGRLAAASGDSKWISGEASRRLVHRLRARVDAVVVGVNTVLKDDPLLTARGVPVRRVARRVVLDTRLRMPRGCRLVKSIDEAPLLILTTRAAAVSAKAQRLRSAGAEVRGVPAGGGLLKCEKVLAALYDLEATNVLVEGGPAVLSAFLSAGLVDEAHVFLAPFLLGGPAEHGLALRPGARTMADAMRPVTAERRFVGEDAYWRLRLTTSPAARGTQLAGERR